MQVQSVSAWPEKRDEIKKMMEMAAKDIERLGGTFEMVDIGKQKVKSPDVDIRFFFKKAEKYFLNLMWEIV